jgi:hypothetical protein
MNHYHEYQLTDLVAQRDHAKNLGEHKEAEALERRIRERYGYRLQDGTPRLVKI